MPEICRFFSIIIKMYYDDHNPPHFHAEYQGLKAVFDIRTGQKTKGKFPKGETKLVEAWISMRQKELMANWRLLELDKELKKIEPLK